MNSKAVMFGEELNFSFDSKSTLVGNEFKFNLCFDEKEREREEKGSE